MPPSSLSYQVANSGSQIRLKSSRFIDHYLYVAAVNGPNYHSTGSTGELTYESVIETVALSSIMTPCTGGTLAVYASNCEEGVQQKALFDIETVALRLLSIYHSIYLSILLRLI